MLRYGTFIKLLLDCYFIPFKTDYFTHMVNDPSVNWEAEVAEAVPISQMKTQGVFQWQFQFTVTEVAERCMSPRCTHFGSVHWTSQPWECTAESDWHLPQGADSWGGTQSLRNAVVLMVSVIEPQRPHVVPSTFSTPTAHQTHYAILKN